MNKPILLTLVAGALFGVWPLIMNKSGFNGYMAAVVFGSCVAFAGFVAQMVFQSDPTHPIFMRRAVLAGIIGAVGTLCYTAAFSQPGKIDLATLVVLQVVMQVMVPAIYQAISTKSMSINTLIGFGLALSGTLVLALKK